MRILEPAKGKDVSDHLAAGLGSDDLKVPDTNDRNPGDPGESHDPGFVSFLSDEKEPLMSPRVKPPARSLHCPSCRTIRPVREIGTGRIGGRRHVLVQCAERACELVWSVRGHAA